jgi:hypothetical protein
MKTNHTRYGFRHMKLTRYAEEEFVARRILDPSFTLDIAVTALSTRTRAAIARRDGISAILAAQAAHLVLHFARPQQRESQHA